MDPEKHFQYPLGSILVFARAPLPGRVKTRLAENIGAQRAATLYTDWLCETVRMCATSALAPVELWCSPDTEHEIFTSLRAAYGLKLATQPQGDLGTRMQAAMHQALQQGEFTVLIGTDCPAMDVDYLASACRVLQAGTELVLGPAEDGGYVLLGARKLDDSLFDGIPWGTGRVLQQTRMRIASIGYRHAELASLWDVDRYEDLQRLESGSKF